MLERITNNLQLIVYFCPPQARVAELVDALDSKSSDFGRVGSIPTSSTDKPQKSGIASEFQKRSSLFFKRSKVILFVVFKMTF